MGVTKQYLRYVPGPIFGIISSSVANVLFVDFRGKKCVAVPACEHVIIWNYRTGERVHELKGDKHFVTCFIVDDSRKNLAVGYADGSIRVFNLLTGQLSLSLSGHKSAVSCLAYDDRSLTLASGGKDTDLVLWDIVAESGLTRLKGHHGPITRCHFLADRDVLLSSSEDALLKFWNINSRHCFKTLVGNKGEIWDFIVLGNSRLITGVNDSDLRVWDIKFSDDVTDEDVDEVSLVELGKIATIGDKATCLGTDKDERILGCHGNGKSLSLYKLLHYEESLKKLHKRRKKERKQMQNLGMVDTEALDKIAMSLCDEVEKLKEIDVGAKIVNFNIYLETPIMGKIAISLRNNSFVIYSIDISQKNTEAVLLNSFAASGHRNHVESLSVCSNDLSVLSASNESIKVWNFESQLCTHTFQCDLVLCCTFVTGDNYIIAGTKTGHLHIFELSSKQLVEKITVSESPVSSLVLTPDDCGVTTANGSDIIFWKYEFVKDDDYSETKKRLSMSQSRIMKMSENIQCLRYSPNHKYIAASLLDCTVKVMFSDTLKFAFSLYGHKLPIPCMDISYDSTILATGSKDKNIKIWSLEFGNCLKSIFAHDESITCLQFLPKTHMIFTASNDKRVKQWDCDNFQKIVTLEGHQNKISSMTISSDGRTVITASRDKSLRLWEKTNEPLVLEEEQENEKEAQLEQEIDVDEPVIPGETITEVGIATRTTVETLKTVEQLIEAIEIFKSELVVLAEYKLRYKTSKDKVALPSPHPMLTAYSTNCPYIYMLKVLQKSRSSNLEKVLLHLPYNYVIDLLKILAEFAQRKWEVELISRCILFLLNIHLRQITVDRDLFPLIEKLKNFVLEDLSELKSIVGVNLAGLKIVQKDIELSEDVCLFADATEKIKRKGRKRCLLTYV